MCQNFLWGGNPWLKNVAKWELLLSTNWKLGVGNQECLGASRKNSFKMDFEGHFVPRGELG